MSRLRNDQGGFTLIELLVTMAVGMIVMAGILGLLDMTLRGSASSLGRTQAVREGRGTIDRVGQELRLASCPDVGSAVISADADTVSYYVSRPLANYQATPVVERHTLAYNAANGTIWLTVSPGTVTHPTWSATPSRRTVRTSGASTPAALMSRLKRTSGHAPSRSSRRRIGSRPPIRAVEISRQVRFSTRPVLSVTRSRVGSWKTTSTPSTVTRTSVSRYR